MARRTESDGVARDCWRRDRRGKPVERRRHRHRALPLDRTGDDATHAPPGTRDGDAAVASLREGDALLVVQPDDVQQLSDRHGRDAVELVLLRLASHLRSGTRPSSDVVARLEDPALVVVLRDVEAPLHTIAARLTDTWNDHGSGHTLSIGGALHERRPPVETLGAARAALVAGQALGGRRILVAPGTQPPSSSTW